MYCPTCGQQQVSDDVRFCSRCGFPLEGVKELITSGGTLAIEKQGNKFSPRRKGMRFGAKLIFCSAVLLPVFIALGIFFDTPAFILISCVLFLAGISRVLYARFFEDALPEGHRMPPLRAGTTAWNTALPSSQSPSVTNSGLPRSTTAEMLPPPSVVEHTTKLLDKTTDS